VQTSPTRTIRARLAGVAALLTAAFTRGPVPEQLATRRGYYNPGEHPQPPQVPLGARPARAGYNPARRQMKALMRELGVTSGRQKRLLRKRARREGWAS
jgi:hypothetical protein